MAAEAKNSKSRGRFDNEPRHSLESKNSETRKFRGQNKSHRYSDNFELKKRDSERHKTIPLKNLNPGEKRIRADGSSDKLHKDRKGFTHSYTDSRGNLHKESIRFNKQGKEVKISDTERRRNGDVITKYRSGISEIRTRDGLRYQKDRRGNTVYQERRDTWKNRPAIYREYKNRHKTTYVQNYYYGRPIYFYRPSLFDDHYYSFTLRSWSYPVQYRWSWNYYNYNRLPKYTRYYTPYPKYYSPAYWLTDYLIMSLIESNYQRNYSDNLVYNDPSNNNYDRNDSYNDYDNLDDNYSEESNQTVLNETIKEEIRQQVEESLRDQQNAIRSDSTMDPAQILTPGRLLVVHAELNVEDQNGGQCQLDEGDVLRLLNQPTSDNQTAQLKVVSAKGSSCPAGTTLVISTENLVEMENEFQTRIQQGMSEMKNNNVGY